MNTPIDVESDYWITLARCERLGILSDLDGTLLPFASTPEEANPSPELKQLINELAELPGVKMAIVSGRPREALDQFFPSPRPFLMVAEHGAWRTGASGWEAVLSADGNAVDTLAAELRSLQAKYPTAGIERKTWSIALHFRRVPAHEKMGLLVQATAILDPWLAAHPDFEDLAGAEVLEIRPRIARKGNAVAWVRGMVGEAGRLLVIGDDVTDEDMFTAASDRDVPVIVGAPQGRLTAARWRLDGTADVHAFYRWLIAARRQATTPLPPRPSRVETVTDGTERFDLLVISNRLPELRSAASPVRNRNVGGLVSALGPALGARKGIWFGWSGRSRPEATPTAVGLDKIDGLALAWVDLPEEWLRHYYNGMSNSALWPLFHSFPTRLKLSHADWHAYERANEAFAASATKLVGQDATIWVHDYHLLLLGKFLRERGHRGPVGFFQHIPFPGPDIFFILPWASEILSAMLAFDVIGFHTAGHVANFLRCAAQVPGARIEGSSVVWGNRLVRVAPFPLGIIPAEFQEQGHASGSDEISGLMRSLGDVRIVLGVDRLDYTKGIPERINAFGSFLQQFPQWRRRTCLIQVSVPSRADIPDYAKQRSRIENIVGRINGEYGEADWVPIRYLYRSYGRAQLSELYRAADVGYVTPLRDGMNLVAKEYVAAQDPDNPGVLLLSKFAGAADELKDALLTNPWDAEGTALNLHQALEMPLEERKARYSKLLEVISKTTALTWAEDFLRALAATRG